MSNPLRETENGERIYQALKRAEKQSVERLSSLNFESDDDE